MRSKDCIHSILLDFGAKRLLDPSVIVLVVLPELTVDGDLPPGVHTADRPGFISRFGGSSPRRLWLAARLRTILKLAGTGGRLRRIFVWGSFVTAKSSPRDVDILLIMSDDFEVEQMSGPAQ